MKNAGPNKVFFPQDRIDELAAFLLAVLFHGGHFTVENGPDFGYTVEVMKK